MALCVVQRPCNPPQCTATHYNILQLTSTHRNSSKLTATQCSTLQHTTNTFGLNVWIITATHCKLLQRTATHCNMLQTHSDSMCGPLSQSGEAIGQKWVQLTATHCSSLQHTATYYKHIRSQRVVLRLNQEKLLDKNGWSFLHPDEQVEILKDQLAQCPCFENLTTSICCYT